MGHWDNAGADSKQKSGRNITLSFGEGWGEAGGIRGKMRK